MPAPTPVDGSRRRPLPDVLRQHRCTAALRDRRMAEQLLDRPQIGEGPLGAWRSCPAERAVRGQRRIRSPSGHWLAACGSASLWRTSAASSWDSLCVNSFTHEVYFALVFALGSRYDTYLPRPDRSEFHED